MKISPLTEALEQICLYARIASRGLGDLHYLSVHETENKKTKSRSSCEKHHTYPRTKFVIQTVKLSLFEENIVYQSFLVAPFTEVTFLLREKVVIRNAPASRCLLSLKSSERMDSFTERVTKSLERMDVFTKRVIKSFKQMSVFTKRVTKSFERMSVFTERVTKSFERMSVFTEWVTKSFERLDVSTERVIKPFERMQIFLNG